MNRYVIVGASRFAPSEELLTVLCEGARVVAADGGAVFPTSVENAVFARIGDFDTAGSVPKGENVVTLPPEKDVTDLHAAAMFAVDNGADEVVLAGCTGGRLDHFWSAAGILEYLENNGVRGCIADDNNLIFYQKAGSEVYEDLGYKYFSVVPLDEKLCGVTLTGLKYTLEDAVLCRAGSLGVSNEFEKSQATVELKSGAALIIHSNPTPTVPNGDIFSYIRR